MAEVQKKVLEIKVKNIREFNLPYWEISSGKEGNCLLTTAALHGCEVIGCEVMRRFCPIAAEKLVKGKILLLPFSNPPALWNRRHNVYSTPNEPKGHGKDNIQGSWPGNPEGHEMEQLAYIINENLVKRATHNIDMHCWSRFMIATAVPDNNKEQIEFARASALPAIKVIPRAPKQGPPLHNIFNSTGRLAFSMEFSGQYMLSEREAKLGVRMLDNCSRYLGLFEGEPEGLEDTVIFDDGSKEMVTVSASENGLFIENGLSVGDRVMKGDLLGTLFSDSTLDVIEIKAPVDGYLYTYGCHRRNADADLAAQHPYADKGDTLAIIFKTS